MRHKQLFLFLITLTLTLIQAACTPTNLATAVATLTPTATDVATASATATLEPTATELPPPTVTPGPSPTPLPTPPVPAAIASKDFLFGSEDSDCRLPCWQGLIVGQSGREDIQLFFDTVFGFNGTREFFPEGETGDSTIPGLALTGHGWNLNAEPYEGFGTRVWADEETYILEGLDISSTADQIDRWLTPQSIIQELGRPSYFLLSIGGTEIGAIGVARLYIIYEEGVLFRFENEINVYPPIISDPPPEFDIIVCLGGRDVES